MGTLVVHAHPLEDSYSAALRDAVLETLEAAAVDHQLARLGAGDEPDLSGVDRLVAVYPTWNGGPPAVMLAWLQRTLAPYVDGEEHGPTPLVGIQTLAVVTSHGSTRFRNRLQGRPGRQTWARVVLPRCAPGACFDWLALYQIDRASAADRHAFIDDVRSYFGR